MIHVHFMPPCPVSSRELGQSPCWAALHVHSCMRVCYLAHLCWVLCRCPMSWGMCTRAWLHLSPDPASFLELWVFVFLLIYILALCTYIHACMHTCMCIYITAIKFYKYNYLLNTLFRFHSPESPSTKSKCFEGRHPVYLSIDLYKYIMRDLPFVYFAQEHRTVTAFFIF